MSLHHECGAELTYTDTDQAVLRAEGRVTMLMRPTWTTTTCTRPSGHEGRHSDGAISWDQGVVKATGAWDPEAL